MENVCIYTLLIVASFQFIETADFSDRSVINVINLLAEKLESTNLKVSELSFALQDTKEEFQKSKKELRKTKKGLKDAKNELKKTKDELKETKDNLEETKVAFEQLKKTCSGKEAFQDVERITQIHAAVLKGFAGEKKSLQQMKSELFKTMAHYEIDMAKPISRYGVNVTSLLKEIETITNENRFFKEEMARHEAEMTSFKMDVELFMNTTMDDIKEDLARYENDMTSFKNKLETIISNENDGSKAYNNYMTNLMSSYSKILEGLNN